MLESPIPARASLLSRCKVNTTTERQLAALLGDAVADNDLVVVDVSAAEFVDASFLHNLVVADRAATARGSRFVLQMGTAYIVRRALEVSGVLESLDVAHSRDEAVAWSTSPDDAPRRGGRLALPGKRLQRC